MLGFKRYQPVGLRVWHWFNAVVIAGLLVTVLLRRTVFGIRGNAELIRAKAADAGATLDLKTARKISEALTDHFWQWHVYLGYGLAGLLGLRILVRLIHQESPWQLTWQGFKSYRRATVTADRSDLLHFTLVRASYLTFYAAVVFMVLSGLAMVFQDELHIPNDRAETLHDVHEWFQWYFLAFVILHIGGVLLAELGKHRGLVSNMIHGGDRASGNPISGDRASGTRPTSGRRQD